MNYVLTVRGADATAAQKQVANLKKSLGGEETIRVVGHPPERGNGRTDTEHKAEPVTLTALVLAFLTGGAAVAATSAVRDVAVKLIDAITGSHPDSRAGSIEYELKEEKTGRSVKFKGDQLTREQAGQTIKTVEEFVKSTSPPPAAAPAGTSAPSGGG